MKLGIIKKDKSKIEIEGFSITISDAGSQIEICYDSAAKPFGDNVFVDKKDIQLIYLGGWK